MFETSMRASASTVRVSLIGVPASAAPDTASSSNAEWRSGGFHRAGLRQPAFAPNCSSFMRCALVRFRRLTRNTASGCCSSACCNSECAASSTMFAPARRGSWPERSACSRACVRRDALEARRHRVIVRLDVAAARSRSVKTRRLPAIASTVPAAAASGIQRRRVCACVGDRIGLAGSRCARQSTARGRARACAAHSSRAGCAGSRTRS